MVYHTIDRPRLLPVKLHAWKRKRIRRSTMKTGEASMHDVLTSHRQQLTVSASARINYIILSKHR